MSEASTTASTAFFFYFIHGVVQALADAGYFADRQLATAVRNAREMALLPFGRAHH